MLSPLFRLRRRSSDAHALPSRHELPRSLRHLAEKGTVSGEICRWSLSLSIPLSLISLIILFTWSLSLSLSLSLVSYRVSPIFTSSSYLLSHISYLLSRSLSLSLSLYHYLYLYPSRIQMISKICTRSQTASLYSHQSFLWFTSDRPQLSLPTRQPSYRRFLVSTMN